MYVLSCYTKTNFISPLFSVQYAVSQYRYLKQWCKKTKWSFSCCLALLLSFSDLQGDIGGLVETSVSKSEINSGDVEVPTILSAVEGSGNVDFKLVRRYRKSKKYSKEKCHRGTQTEAVLLSGLFMIK